VRKKTYDKIKHRRLRTKRKNENRSGSKKNMLLKAKTERQTNQSSTKKKPQHRRS